MIRWFYIWSPRYEFFHHLLQSSLTDISGIILTPLFFPQSFFESRAKENEHTFTGNAIKLRLLVSALEHHPGETILFTDVDLMVLEPTSLVSCIQSYSASYDMVFMKEGVNNDAYNIGMMLIRSTPETISFYRMLIDRVEEKGLHDQTEVNAQLHLFSGAHSSFPYPNIMQSNDFQYLMAKYKTVEAMNPFVIQCLSQLPGYERSFAEKVFSVAQLMDITPLKEFIPKECQKILIDTVRLHDPDHYIASWT